jgi:sporulation protein YlmC with PRC-barrel domain
MASLSHEYRKIAAECAELAEAAPSQSGRGSFSAAAKHWMMLAQLAEGKSFLPDPTERSEPMRHHTESSLIPSGKIFGAPVYNTLGEDLGEIQDLMIDGATGRVEFAVVASGGFLGVGRKHYPLPWPDLLFSAGQHGYVVNMSKAELEDASRT